MTHRFRLYRLYLNFVMCVQDQDDQERELEVSQPAPARKTSKGGGTAQGSMKRYVISVLCNAYAN